MIVFIKIFLKIISWYFLPQQSLFVFSRGGWNLNYFRTKICHHQFGMTYCRHSPGIRNSFVKFEVEQKINQGKYLLFSEKQNLGILLFKCGTTRDFGQNIVQKHLFIAQNLMRVVLPVCTFTNLFSFRSDIIDNKNNKNMFILMRPWRFGYNNTRLQFSWSLL